jgi:sugar phosphate isomerase/epimerase
MPAINRREFLQYGAGAMALAALPAWAAGRSPAKISLGHSLYGMQTVPLAEAVAHCARIGFSNVELMLDPGFTAEPAKLSKAARRELRTQLASLGLSVSALMRNLRLVGGLTPAQNLDAIKEAAELAHDVAPDAPPPIETILGGKPPQWLEVRQQMAEGLRGWAAAAEAADIELLIKAHVSMAADTPDKILWLLGQAPSPRLNVTFDYGHFEPQGLSLEETWNALRSRSKFIHVKDIRREGDKLQMLLPGDGTTDYVKYFRLLQSTGYRGAVVVEVSSMLFRVPGYDPIATAEKCHRFLSRAMTEAGLPA